MRWREKTLSQRVWNEERDSQLRALAKVGLPVASIALMMGKTVGDIRGRAAILKIAIRIADTGIEDL